MAKKAIKGLMPSLREKKRYLVFEVLSEQPVKDRKAVNREILSSFLSLYGETGLAEAGILTLPDFDEKSQKGIIKVSTKSVEKARTALMMVKSINSADAAVRTAFVSGTLKKARGSLAS